MSNAVAERPTRSALNTAMQQTSGGAIAFAPNTFDGLLQVSSMMANAGAAVPKHLRNNAGMCMSVAMVAYQNGFNPFLLAADTYVVNDILAWGAKSISAMINNSPRLEGRLSISYGGQWPNRTCTVRGKIKGDPEVKEFTTNAATITTRNSPNWKQQPDVQLAYVAQRNWARIHMSEVTLGLLDSDEASDAGTHQGPDNAKDVTPARPQRSDFTGGASTVVDVEAEPDPFVFTDADGEVRETSNVHEFVSWLIDRLDAETDINRIEGLWETNSGQLDRVRAADAKLADEAHESYGLALDRAYVNGSAQDHQPAEETAAQVLERIITEMEATTTEADFMALVEKYSRHVAEAGKADKDAYRATMKRYDAKLAALRAAEG
jgi:hypothetical protein